MSNPMYSEGGVTWLDKWSRIYPKLWKIRVGEQIITPQFHVRIISRISRWRMEIHSRRSSTGVNLQLRLWQDPEMQIYGDFRRLISVEQHALLDVINAYIISRNTLCCLLISCGTANRRNIRRYLYVLSPSSNTGNYTAVELGC